MPETKKMVNMLLKELRYYYGEFNFDLLEEDVSKLLSVAKEESFPLVLAAITNLNFTNIGEVRTLLTELEYIKSVYGW